MIVLHGNEARPPRSPSIQRDLSPVHGIESQRMPDESQMNADLMAPAGSLTKFEPGEFPEALQRLPFPEGWNSRLALSNGTYAPPPRGV